MKLKTTRVQMELPEKSISRLKEIKIKTESISYAEVVKNALRAYEKLIELQEENNIIFIKSTDTGEIREIEFFV